MNFFSAELEEEILEQVKKNLKKKVEGKELKGTLEEYSTKFGEDE